MGLERRIFLPFDKIDLLRIGDLVLLHEFNPESMLIHIIRLLAPSFLRSRNINLVVLLLHAVLIGRGRPHTFILELGKIDVVRKIIEILGDPVRPVGTCLPARALECRSSICKRKLINRLLRWT